MVGWSGIDGEILTWDSWNLGKEQIRRVRERKSQG